MPASCLYGILIVYLIRYAIRRSETMEKPDYIKNFARPANTEIKFIKGHWYLYERHSVYDPQLGRSRKISGKILGSITEQGLVPSRARRECDAGCRNISLIYGSTFIQQQSSVLLMTAVSAGCSFTMRTASYLIFIRICLLCRDPSQSS